MEKVSKLCSNSLSLLACRSQAFPHCLPVSAERSTGRELLPSGSALSDSSIDLPGRWKLTGSECQQQSSVPGSKSLQQQQKNFLRGRKWNTAGKTSLKLGQNLGVTFTLKKKKHLENSLFLNPSYCHEKFNFFWSASIPKWGMWRVMATTEYGADPLK